MSKSQINRNKNERLKNVITTSTVQDVIHGKLNSNEWSALIEEEETENFAMYITQEILNDTLKSAFDCYLARQLIPFTVTQASEALLKMLELEFMFYDPGESDIQTNYDWKPDLVPDSCPIDSWAQGAISKRYEVFSATNPELVQTTLSADMKKLIMNCKAVNEKPNEMKKPREPQTKHKSSSDERRPFIPERTKHKDGVRREYRVRIPSKDTGKAAKPTKTPEKVQMECKLAVNSQEKTVSTLAPTKRKVGTGALEYDDEGNLISVPRMVQVSAVTGNESRPKQISMLSPFSQTPSVQWEVLPQSPVQKDTQLRAAQLAPSKKPVQVSTSEKRPHESQRNQQFKSMLGGLYNVSELIELAAGVSISDGQHTKMGPRISAVSQLETQPTVLRELDTFTEWSTEDKNIPSLDPKQLLQLDAIRVVSGSYDVAGIPMTS